MEQKQIKIYVILLAITSLIFFNACEKDNTTTSSNSSFNDYVIDIEVKNTNTQIGVTGAKVKLGAKDTGLNSEVGDFGCKNLGMSTTNSNGKTSLTAKNFAGEPTICNVEVYNPNGSSAAIDDYYYNSQIRKIIIWIF